MKRGSEIFVARTPIAGASLFSRANISPLVTSCALIACPDFDLTDAREKEKLCGVGNKFGSYEVEEEDFNFRLAPVDLNSFVKFDLIVSGTSLILLMSKWQTTFKGINHATETLMILDD